MLSELQQSASSASCGRAPARPFLTRCGATVKARAVHSRNAVAVDDGNSYLAAGVTGRRWPFLAAALHADAAHSPSRSGAAVRRLAPGSNFVVRDVPGEPACQCRTTSTHRLGHRTDGVASADCRTARVLHPMLSHLIEQHPLIASTRPAGDGATVASHQPSLPASPLNGPVNSGVIQPP